MAEAAIRFRPPLSEKSGTLHPLLPSHEIRTVKAESRCLSLILRVLNYNGIHHSASNRPLRSTRVLHNLPDQHYSCMSTLRQGEGELQQQQKQSAHLLRTEASGSVAMPKC